jgi:hypothetical protein
MHFMPSTVFPSSLTLFKIIRSDFYAVLFHNSITVGLIPVIFSVGDLASLPHL